MKLTAILRRSFATSPMLAAAAYAGTVLALLVMVVGSSSTFSASALRSQHRRRLEQLDGRKAAHPADDPPTPRCRRARHFWKGDGHHRRAALLQRVAGAVTKLGGNVLSSQLDVQGTPSKAGFVSMIASCEIDQPALQPLIYDLEAGMPFLFIDQLAVQAPTTSQGEGKLRILLAVSGQWQGVK